MYKKMFFEISQNSQESTCTRASPVPKTFNFIKKETLAQVFSCEFCETSQSTFFYRTPVVAAFEINIKLIKNLNAFITSKCSKKNVEQ